MKVKDVVSAEVVKASAGGSYDDLETDLVKPGTVLEIRHISIENKTTDFDSLRVGVADGISFYEKEEDVGCESDTLYWSKSKFLIPPGKKFRARLFGCTSGDDLRFWYEGLLYEVD